MDQTDKIKQLEAGLNTALQAVTRWKREAAGCIEALDQVPLVEVWVVLGQNIHAPDGITAHTTREAAYAYLDNPALIVAKSIQGGGLCCVCDAPAVHQYCGACDRSTGNKIRQAERVAKAAEIKLKAQLDGNLSLRKELGAHDHETFFDFVRRLASERGEPQIKAPSVVWITRELDGEIRSVHGTDPGILIPPLTLQKHLVVGTSFKHDAKNSECPTCGSGGANWTAEECRDLDNIKTFFSDPEQKRSQECALTRVAVALTKDTTMASGATCSVYITLHQARKAAKLKGGKYYAGWFSVHGALPNLGEHETTIRDAEFKRWADKEQECNEMAQSEIKVLVAKEKDQHTRNLQINNIECDSCGAPAEHAYCAPCCQCADMTIAASLADGWKERAEKAEAEVARLHQTACSFVVSKLRALQDRIKELETHECGRCGTSMDSVWNTAKATKRSSDNGSRTTCVDYNDPPLWCGLPGKIRRMGHDIHKRSEILDRLYFHFGLDEATWDDAVDLAIQTKARAEKAEKEQERLKEKLTECLVASRDTDCKTVLFNLRSQMAQEWQTRYPGGKLPDRIGWALMEALQVFYDGKVPRGPTEAEQDEEDQHIRNLRINNVECDSCGIPAEHAYCEPCYQSAGSRIARAENQAKIDSQVVMLVQHQADELETRAEKAEALNEKRLRACKRMHHEWLCERENGSAVVAECDKLKTDLVQAKQERDKATRYAATEQRRRELTVDKEVAPGNKISANLGAAIVERDVLRRRIKELEKVDQRVELFVAARETAEGDLEETDLSPLLDCTVAQGETPDSFALPVSEERESTSVPQEIQDGLQLGEELSYDPGACDPGKFTVDTDALPVCPKCGHVPKCYLYSFECTCGGWDTRESWIRHCAENTPCRDCGELPTTVEGVLDHLCGMCDHYNRYTSVEWLDHNRKTGEHDKHVVDTEQAVGASTTVSGPVLGKEVLADTDKPSQNGAIGQATSDALKRAQELPKCPVCKKSPVKIGLSAQRNLPIYDCTCGRQVGNDAWFCHCAKNTPCIRCGKLPELTCGKMISDLVHLCSTWRPKEQTLWLFTEWLDHNKKVNRMTGDKCAICGVSVTIDTGLIHRDTGKTHCVECAVKEDPAFAVCEEQSTELETRVLQLETRFLQHDQDHLAYESDTLQAKQHIDNLEASTKRIDAAIDQLGNRFGRLEKHQVEQSKQQKHTKAWVEKQYRDRTPGEHATIKLLRDTLVRLYGKGTDKDDPAKT